MECNIRKRRKQVSKSDSDSCDENESSIHEKFIKEEPLSSSESNNTEDFNLQNNLGDIKWTTQSCRLTIHDFTEEQSGIRIDISDSWSILQFFELFISEELIDFIVEKMNSQWSRVNKRNPESGTERGELYCFIAVCFLMSRNKRLSIEEYWSTNELLRSDIFGKTMSRERYKQLLRMLHFADDHEYNYDRLWKIREVMDRLRRSFANAFYPYQNLYIDESLVSYKNMPPLKQINFENKSKKVGIKSTILRDCKTGYIQDFIVYNESDPTYSHVGIGKAGNSVITLLVPYLDKGHTLFMDNCYASPPLFKLLHMKSTNACGTVNKQTKGMPKMREKLEKGEASYRYSDNLLAMKWMYNKEIFMLSTMHSDVFVSLRKHGKKKGMFQQPACIHDYNNIMSAVERTDVVLSTITSRCKSRKWHKNYFMHMIDMCIWNAYCLYKLKIDGTMSIAKFHLKLIEQLLAKYQTQRSCFYKSFNSSNDDSSRLIERHFPSLYVPRGKNKIRRCTVCSKNNRRRESRYQCEDCNVGLCIYPCFKIFHTIKDY